MPAVSDGNIGERNQAIFVQADIERPYQKPMTVRLNGY